jgi:hypothetical protein
MRKIISIILFTVFLFQAASAQTISDTGTLRKEIRKINNLTIRQSQTGIELNRILNGYLNTPMANLPFKWYEGFITQSSTSTPTFTVIYNNTGLTITSAYDSVGRYLLTGMTSVNANKLWYQISNSFGFTQVSRVDSTGKIRIITTDTSRVMKNGILSNSPIIIKVYK